MTAIERVQKLRDAMRKFSDSVDADIRTSAGRTIGYFTVPATRPQFQALHPHYWDTVKKLHTVAFGGNIDPDERLAKADELHQDMIQDLVEGVWFMGTHELSNAAARDWQKLYRHLTIWHDLIGEVFDGYEAPEPKTVEQRLAALEEAYRSLRNPRMGD